MKQFLVVLLLSKLVSCNNGEQTTESTNNSLDSGAAKPPAIENNRAENVSGCYMKILGRDTAILMLDQKGAELTGKLLYDNFEKDGSSGIVKGKEEDQILKLWYDFQSEGMHSVMEVYFKKDSGRLLRGIGTMNVKSDTTYFTTGVNYSEKEAFNKIECDLIKWKFE